jgi:hypothetical protein
MSSPGLRAFALHKLWRRRRPDANPEANTLLRQRCVSGGVVAD